MFSLVVPFHSDVGRLGETIRLIKCEASAWHVEETLLCHNGGPLSDAARRQIEELITPGMSLLHTDSRGIGAGYRLGIENARAQRVVLSASDLPFHFSDIESLLRVAPAGPMPRVAIGSKLHPQSDIGAYGIKRRAFSYAFFAYRRLLFGAGTPRDTQGTILIETELARQLLPRVTSDDFRFSLELVVQAIRAGVRPVEVPVKFVPNESDDVSSVSAVRDGWRMLRESWRLRSEMRNEGR